MLNSHSSRSNRVRACLVILQVVLGSLLDRISSNNSNSLVKRNLPRVLDVSMSIYLYLQMDNSLPVFGQQPQQQPSTGIFGGGTSLFGNNNNQQQNKPGK